MILLDFRKWEFKTSYIPNVQKELLQRDFDALFKTSDFDVLASKNVEPFCVSSLFFKNKKHIAVSAIKNITNYYNIIDKVLEVEHKEIIDYSEAAEEEVYFYGSNSLVAHATSEIALCGVNEFSDEALFEEYCEDFEMNPLVFSLPENLLTSDVAFFVNNKLLMCLEFVKDKKMKKQLLTMLKINNIELINFTKEQVTKGVFNAKVVAVDKLLISKSAYDLFTEKQKEALLEVRVEEVCIPFLEAQGVWIRDLIF